MSDRYLKAILEPNKEKAKEILASNKHLTWKEKHYLRKIAEDVRRSPTSS